MGVDDLKLKSEEARAEYAALRAELDRRSTIQQALVVLQLTGVVAIVAAAAHSTSKSAAAPFFGKSAPFYLVALVPLISFALAHLWMDHDAWIGRIGEYIGRKIEHGREMNWQTEIKARDEAPSRDWSRYGYVLAYWCIFAVPSAFALVGLARNASGFLQWLAVGGGVTLTTLITAEWTLRIGWRRSKRRTRVASGP